MEDQELSPAKNIENKVKKLALKYGKGEFSYLYWPCTTNLTDARLHITSKFFGEDPITVEEIRGALDMIGDFDKPLDWSELEWEPVVFATKNDGAVAVLELIKFPPELTKLHAALMKYHKDDYQGYRPHITVSQEVWEAVAEKKLTPQQCDLKVLDLELCIQGLVKFKWGPEGGDVEEIDGEDVHTINPTHETMAKRTINALKAFSGKK